MPVWVIKCLIGCLIVVLIAVSHASNRISHGFWTHYVCRHFKEVKAKWRNCTKTFFERHTRAQQSYIYDKRIITPHILHCRNAIETEQTVKFQNDALPRDRERIRARSEWLSSGTGWKSAGLMGREERQHGKRETTWKRKREGREYSSCHSWPEPYRGLKLIPLTRLMRHAVYN